MSSSSAPSAPPSAPRLVDTLAVAALSPKASSAPASAPAPSASASASTALRKDPLTLMLLQMAAGAGAGAVAKTATAPLERLKILFQVQGMAERDLVAPKYRGIFQATRVVIAEEGVRGLWKGNLTNVLRVIPVYGLKFAFNDSIKAVVAGPSNARLSTGQLLWVGTLAGLLQTALTYPMETVRTRLTLGPEQGVRYNGIVDCFRQMVRTEGWGGLFKGFGPTMVSGAPYTGLQMTSYEIMKRNAPEFLPADGMAMQLVAGAVSGLVAQTVTYPGDTVRRRMQNNGAGGAPKTYRNSFHCTYLIYKNEGLGGFFKGAWTNTVRAVPGAAVQFAAYEFLKKSFNC